MAYLDDHPPNHQQFRCPRRERPSGIIGVHTAESHPDESGPDTGAENVADFIRRRSSYGSYHLLADSDSIVQLVRFGCVAYHIATHGLNEHTIGISAATQAHRWNSLSSGYRDAMVRNMARAAARAARWLQQHYGITVPARRISLAQARRGERGFLAHGDADPDRRTDPGATFPWGDFLGYYADEMNGDDMPTAQELLDAKVTDPWGKRRPLGEILSATLKHAQNMSEAGDFMGDPRTEDGRLSLRHGLNRTLHAADGANGKLAKVLANQRAIMQAQGVEVDEQALATEIAAVLAPAVIAALPDLGLTEEQLEGAIRDVFGSLADA